MSVCLLIRYTDTVWSCYGLPYMCILVIFGNTQFSANKRAIIATPSNYFGVPCLNIAISKINLKISTLVVGITLTY